LVSHAGRRDGGYWDLARDLSQIKITATIVPADIPFVSGAPVLRVEDERLLTGGGQFLDDREVSDLAHAAVVRSPYPHARILEVDVAAARIIPGVLLVLTGEDYVADGLGSIPCQDACQTRDGTPRPDLPFPALARERVLYVGEAVAYHCRPIRSLIAPRRTACHSFGHNVRRMKCFMPRKVIRNRQI
jgi:hypothetical protein